MDWSTSTSISRGCVLVSEISESSGTGGPRRGCIMKEGAGAREPVCAVKG